MNAHGVRIEEMTAADDDERPSQPSTIALLRDAVDKGSDLITQEIRLAKQEIAATVRAGVATVIGGAIAAFSLIAFLILAIVTIVIAVPLPWAAALGFAVLFLAIAVAAAMFALRQAGGLRPLRQTADTIKEDVLWAKQQLTLGDK
jgi:uncharacterized membrane protein YqjE